MISSDSVNNFHEQSKATIEAPFSINNLSSGPNNNPAAGSKRNPLFGDLKIFEWTLAWPNLSNF